MSLANFFLMPLLSKIDTIRQLSEFGFQGNFRRETVPIGAAVR